MTGSVRAVSRLARSRPLARVLSLFRLEDKHNAKPCHARDDDGLAWSTDAARPLTEAFNGAPGAPGTVIAVACIDDAEPVIQVNPGDTLPYEQLITGRLLTPRSRSPTARSACGSASSRRARSQA
jgi:hypothetical protein